MGGATSNHHTGGHSASTLRENAPEMTMDIINWDSAYLCTASYKMEQLAALAMRRENQLKHFPSSTPFRAIMLIITTLLRGDAYCLTT